MDIDRRYRREAITNKHKDFWPKKLDFNIILESTCNLALNPHTRSPEMNFGHRQILIITERL